MKRFILSISLIMLGVGAFSAPAQAQRQGANISQGVTSGDLASSVDSLRASNAELRVRLTGLEADRADLDGKVETLEFLLSQSRDQINRMQTDDAEIGNLIGRLEDRLAAQDTQIKSLQTRLDQMTADDLGQASVDMGLTRAPSSLSEASEQAEASVQPMSTTSGPTRIVRRVENGEVTATTSSSDSLPQGTLGTISAAALPGEAGPLFAEAKSRLLQFDYAGAENAFRSFLDLFQDDPQAGEAQYWLGEVLYQQEAYSESGQAYTQMIREYPDDPRAPEALAKLARSMRLVGDTEKACSALDILPQRYPDASGVTRNLALGERVRSGCDS